MSKYYIARDKCGSLHCFDKKPVKDDLFEQWLPDVGVDLYLHLDNDEMFPEVKWKDEEPKVLTIEE